MADNVDHANTCAEDLVHFFKPMNFPTLQNKPKLYNIWTEAGLCNGALGTVVDFVFPEGQQPPSLPICVIVQFDEPYNGPSVSPDLPRCVPICPITQVSQSLGYNAEKQQLPLRLAWAMTIHKCQGLTLEKAWIDLGKSENVTGMTHVALSRVRNLSDLVLEPLTFERL